MRPPKISIITPVLNSVSTLEKALHSVISQDYPHLEFIVLDGGSTDGTVEIIKKYAPHLAYWHCQKDKNASSAVNEGLARASGDLVALLMADDYYEPHTLTKIGEGLIKNPESDLITCGGRLIYYDTQHNAYKTKRSFTTQSELALSFMNVCFYEPAICCRFFRKSLFDRIGLLHADRNGEHLLSCDKEFLLRAIIHGAKNTVIDHVGYNYLAHPGSSTFSGNRKTTVRLYREHMTIAEDYLKKSELTTEQRHILTYWYRHQAARLAFYDLSTGNFQEGWALMKQGIQKDKLAWLSTFIHAPFDYLLRKYRN